MSGKIFWKLVVTALLAAMCIYYLVPLQDRDFADFARKQTDNVEFHQLMDRAVEQAKASERLTSSYVVLKAIANEERIDLTRYFPQYEIEASLVNVVKRNNILLPELLKRSKANLKKGLDIEGGVSVTFQADPEALAKLPVDDRESQLADAVKIIENRVNGLGVSEPIVRPVGDSRIEVQLAGVNTKDHPDLLEVIGKPARLEFREVHRTLTPGAGTPTPAGYEIMAEIRDAGGVEYEEEMFVKRVPALTGRFVDQAFVRSDPMGGGIEVILNLTGEGEELFADVTGRLSSTEGFASKGRLAIVLDGMLQSAPTAQSRITGGTASITGRYTEREAFDLANALNNPLDIKLTVAEMYEVGPSMAASAVSSGVRASIIGASAVSVFMIAYYLIGGVVALLSVALNILIVLGMLASFGATLTLPGIAGIILTVGMAVDANILIFERIREELRSGKSLKNALNGGFDKVFSTITDANVTTLVVALVMIFLGTGPVKGFGVTLAIGIASTLFCALIATRALLEVLFASGWITKFNMLSIIKDPQIDFLKYRKPAFIASWTLVAVGIVVLAVRGNSIYGIDFTGGDEVILHYEKEISTDALASTLAAALEVEVTPSYRTVLGTDAQELRVQVPFQMGDRVLPTLVQAYPDAGFTFEGKNEIGPSVGKEIQLNAFMAIGLSLGLILIYIAFRFEIGYGIGAIVATVHDVLLTIGVFVMFPDHQFTAPMVAAILLIVGYSLNDTIVCFDRIREELTLRPTMDLREIINVALNAVLSRTMLTSITTLLASVSLMVFGTGVINDIAFTFTIGIITGTFSSVFIASPVFYWWHKGNRSHVESTHDVLPEYDWQTGASSSSKSVKE